MRRIGSRREVVLWCGTGVVVLGRLGKAGVKLFFYLMIFLLFFYASLYASVSKYFDTSLSLSLHILFISVSFFLNNFKSLSLILNSKSLCKSLLYLPLVISLYSYDFGCGSRNSDCCDAYDSGNGDDSL